MYYVELLYARTRFLWYTAICLGIAAVFSYFVSFPPAGAHIENNGQDIPLDVVLLFASFIAMIMSSMLAATLNRDQSHLSFIWTKPVARERIALSYMLVDVTTIILSYFVLFIVIAGVLAIPPQNHMITGPMTGSVLARAIAVPLMAYAVVEVATSWSPVRLAAAQGLWWPVGIALLFLSEVRFPFPIAQLVTLVNFLNPLAYLPESRGHVVNVEFVQGAHPLTLGFDTTTIIAYCIFIAGCVIAIYNWKRMEA